jgi:hypothetical protein
VQTISLFMIRLGERRSLTKTKGINVFDKGASFERSGFDPRCHFFALHHCEPEYHNYGVLKWCELDSSMVVCKECTWTAYIRPQLETKAIRWLEVLIWLSLQNLVCRQDKWWLRSLLVGFRTCLSDIYNTMYSHTIAAVFVIALFIIVVVGQVVSPFAILDCSSETVYTGDHQCNNNLTTCCAYSGTCCAERVLPIRRDLRLCRNRQWILLFPKW